MSRATALAIAIQTHESGGNYHARGASGEGGSMQYMPSTWKAHSAQVYGKVLEKTPEREWYVATRMIQKWIDQGYTEGEIALMWNSGRPSNCSAGVNKFGVKYDSCAYKRHVLALL